MLVHKGMVYVIEGDIVFLSQTALRNLGVIPKMFPMIGELGGVEQQGNGSDIVEIDSKFNFRYIAADPVVESGTLHDIDHEEQPSATQLVNDQNDGEPNGVSTGEMTSNESEFEEPEAGESKDTHTNVQKIQTAIRQPPGECDPESDLPCSCPRRSFAEPPDQLTMPATRSNVPALEGWIREHFKESAFNQCWRQQRIHTKADTAPYFCKKPTLVALNFQTQVKSDIEADVMKGILERVPTGEHDTWCSRLVIQEKKNSKARRTVDLSYILENCPPPPPRKTSRR